MNPKSITQIHHADRDRGPLDRADAANRGVAQARGGLGGRHAVRVRLLVDEAQRVDRLESGIALPEAVRVQQQLEARGR
jgi:hypothetical protein